MIPETRYARAGEVHIAYQVLGSGPVDIVLADQWFSHMDGQWDVPPLAEFRRRLAAFSRVIMFDKRGIGLSDPVPLSELPTLEVWIEDLRTVMDAAGSIKAAIVTNIGGALMSLVCAAAFPDRISAQVIVDGFARFPSAPDYPFGAPPGVIPGQLDAIEREFGRGLMVDLFAPSLRADATLRAQWARFERLSASPGSARAMVKMIYESDVRDVLPTIQVPTLVIHHRDVNLMPPPFGRYIAEHVPGARYVEVPGIDNLIWAQGSELIVAEIQEFVTGARSAPETSRVLSTVLFTDIVDSTVRAATLGDGAWRTLLERHETVVRAEVARGGGRFVKSTGDGVLATFDGPARAVRTAAALHDALRPLGIAIRAGVHTGEIELVGEDVAGVGVHIAARVMSEAGSGEILASSTVRDLVAGSGITFVDRGTHSLKGVPTEWHLYAVTGS